MSVSRIRNLGAFICELGNQSRLDGGVGEDENEGVGASLIGEAVVGNARGTCLTSSASSSVCNRGLGQPPHSGAVGTK